MESVASLANVHIAKLSRLECTQMLRFEFRNFATTLLCTASIGIRLGNNTQLTTPLVAFKEYTSQHLQCRVIEANSYLSHRTLSFRTDGGVSETDSELQKFGHY